MAEQLKLKAIRQKLLQEMAQQAAFDGMGRDALLMAADNLAIERDYASLLFEDADSGTIAHYYWQMRIEHLQEALSVETKDMKGVTEKVSYGVKLFLKGTDAHQGQTALQYATAHLLLPSKIKLLMKHIWQVCDVIWHFAGDNSTDHNYYTKRILLSKALIASLCFYFQDEEVDKKASERFIDAQLNMIVFVGKNISSGQKIVKNMGDTMVVLLKTLSAHSDGLKLKPSMPHLRMQENSHHQAQNNPIFITRKLMKNFIKRRVQNLTPSF